MRYLSAILIAFAGCSQAPQLRFVDFGSNEFVNPMPFALKIDHSGSAIQIDAIEGDCRTVVAVSPDPDAKLPNAPMLVGLTADGNKTLGRGETITIDGMTDVWCVMGWQLPKDSPPLLGFFEARFTLKRNGVEIFTTPYYAFAMQSRVGVFEEVVAEVSEDRDDARALIKMIDGMRGRRSACIKALRVALTVALPPAA